MTVQNRKLDLAMRGSAQAARHTQKMIEAALVDRRKLDPEPLIRAQKALSDAQAALAEWRRVSEPES